MESITHILETRNGYKHRKKLLYIQTRVITRNSAKIFNKDQKKEAKLNYKNSLKKIISSQSQKKMNLIEHLVKQPFPNWNIKYLYYERTINLNSLSTRD